MLKTIQSLVLHYLFDQYGSEVIHVATQPCIKLDRVKHRSPILIISLSYLNLCDLTYNKHFANAKASIYHNSPTYSRFCYKFKKIPTLRHILHQLCNVSFKD